MSLEKLKKVIDNYLNSTIDKEIQEYQEMYSWESIDESIIKNMHILEKKTSSLRPRHKDDMFFWTEYETIIEQIEKKNKT